MTPTVPSQAPLTLPELLSLSDAEFVRAAYLSLLGRTVDEVGYKFYLGQLAAGVDRIEILRQLRSGPEGKRRYLKTRMLDRAIRRQRILRLPLVGALLKRLIAPENRHRNVDRRSLLPASTSYAHGNQKISPLIFFDEGWYLNRHPEVDRLLSTPFNWFLREGGLAGHWPSPIFHSDFYLNQNPDVRAAGLNPLLHYIATGEQSGRRPNALFDPQWYRATYGTEAAIGGSPLAHFMVHGGFDTSPSKYFDAVKYFRDYPELCKRRINPLQDYFSGGMQEGRRALPIEGCFAAANTTPIVAIKNDRTESSRVAIFVTYSADGLIRADVTPYLDALRRNEVAVVLVVASDRVHTYVPEEVAGHCMVVLVRQNAGFDFSAWAHAIQEVPRVLNADVLYLLNDSVIGPTSFNDFRGLLSKIDESDADVVGLTANRFFCWHLQSYFLAIKNKVLSSYWFSLFFLDVANLDKKDAVILLYELTFTARMQARGFKCKPIFDQLPDAGDHSIQAWNTLLQSGMPFVKRSLIDGEHVRSGGAAVVEALRGAGYPVELLSARLPSLVTKAQAAIATLETTASQDGETQSCPVTARLENSLRVRAQFLEVADLPRDERAIVVAFDVESQQSFSYERLAEHQAELVVMVPSGASVRSDILAQFLCWADDHPEVDIFYAEEIILDKKANRVSHCCKPEFNLPMLVASDYIGFPIAIRRSSFPKLGDASLGRVLSSHYALLVRAARRGLKLRRIPSFLITVRPYPKPSAQARLTVLNQEIKNLSSSRYSFSTGLADNTLRIQKTFDAHPKVTIVVPTMRSCGRNGNSSRPLVLNLLESLAQVSWPRDKIEVLIGDDVGGPDIYQDANSQFKLQVVTTPRLGAKQFNYAQKMNSLWRLSATENLIFLNDDLVIKSRDLIESLLTFSTEPDVGGCGALLLFPDGTLQHAGMIGGIFEVFTHPWYKSHPEEATYGDWAMIHREYSAVTGAVFATRKSVLERVAGFDEFFSLDFNDVDLCLRMREAGFRIVYTPFARAVHVEAASRAGLRVPGEQVGRFLSRWRNVIASDPMYSPNLSRDSYQVSCHLDV